MHAESGFWRPKPDGSIEVVISQSTGLVEVQVTASSNSIELPLSNFLMLILTNMSLPFCFFFAFLWLFLKGIDNLCALAFTNNSIQIKIESFDDPDSLMYIPIWIISIATFGFVGLDWNG